MTKTFCDICGKELGDKASLKAYSLALQSKNRAMVLPSLHFDDVCPKCAGFISNFIDSLIPNKKGEVE